MLRRLATIAFAMTISTAASAEMIPSDMDLRGVKALRIAVSPLPVAALDCNIDGTMLGRELGENLERANLSGTSDTGAVSIVTVLSSHDAESAACTSTIMLGAYKKASFFDDAVGWIRTGYVVMWQSAVHVSSPLDRHPAQARDAIALLADAMLTSWRDVNAPQPSR